MVDKDHSYAKRFNKFAASHKVSLTEQEPKHNYKLVKFWRTNKALLLPHMDVPTISTKSARCIRTTQGIHEAADNKLK